jgi:dihydropteroate synthase
MAKLRARLGKIKVGDGLPVVVMGVLNLSQDSFYRGSIVRSSAEAVRKAREMVDEGANIIDIGAIGTGPHSKPITVKLEFDRLVPAVRALGRELGVPISADTQRAEIAEAAVSAGASIINDISGLKSDPRMAEVISKSGCSALLMAARKTPGDTITIEETRRALTESLRICKNHGIWLNRVVIDPAVGYWPGRLKRLGRKAHENLPGRPYSRAASMDLDIISELQEFRKIGQPICVGLSRKSFIGSVLNLRDPSKRLAGSLAASAIAVINGAHVLRTHDPVESIQAARVAEAMKKF